MFAAFSATKTIEHFDHRLSGLCREHILTGDLFERENMKYDDLIKVRISDMMPKVIDMIDGMILQAVHDVDIQVDKDALRHALEKENPMRPIIFDVNDWESICKCPNCKKEIYSIIDGEMVAGKKQNYCDECGQRLDWSKE